MHTLIESMALWRLVEHEDHVHEAIVALAFLAILLAPCIAAIFGSSSDSEEPT
jgi:hypothetical protein